MYNLSHPITSDDCKASNEMDGWSCLDNQQKDFYSFPTPHLAGPFWHLWWRCHDWNGPLVSSHPIKICPSKPLFCLLVGKCIWHCSDRGVCFCLIEHAHILLIATSFSLVQTAWAHMSPPKNHLLKWYWETRRKISLHTVPSNLHCPLFVLNDGKCTCSAQGRGRNSALNKIHQGYGPTALWGPSKWGLLSPEHIPTLAFPALWYLQMHMGEHSKSCSVKQGLESGGAAPGTWPCWTSWSLHGMFMDVLVAVQKCFLCCRYSKHKGERNYCVVKYFLSV